MERESERWTASDWSTEIIVVSHKIMSVYYRPQKRIFFKSPLSPKLAIPIVDHRFAHWDSASKREFV